MSNTLKYILVILGLLVLTAAVALYLKPEIFESLNSQVFPARVENEKSDIGAGTVIYENDEGVEIAVTGTSPVPEFNEQEPVVILYQDSVIEGAEPVTFTGVYQEYNTGCFADGECYAIVDGNHITTILGWTQGSVGVFENPDLPIGTQVEVYALPTESGKYTLYGSKDFYIKEI